MSLLPPYVAFRGHRDRYVSETVTYSGNQCLDIWREHHGAHYRHPILIFVPGGAWVTGSRATGQGHALMSRMVQRGWACLSIDYRTAPLHRWPAPFEDVCAAVRWAHDNADTFGGDRDFIAIAGASAGGHMATLAGMRPGFVDAAVGIYGSYDWTSRSTVWRKVFMNYLERVVVGQSLRQAPNRYLMASPMDMVNPAAAPTMLVHGTADALIPVGEAREFYRRLSSESSSAVDYLEIPGGVHGFDLVNAAQTLRATRGIADFLDRELANSRSAGEASA